MELAGSLGFSLFGYGYYTKPQPPQPPVVVNILPSPCNCRACRGTKKKKKKVKNKKKKLHPQVDPRLTNYTGWSHAVPAGAATRQNSLYSSEKHQMYTKAMGASGNNTNTYCRRTRQVYESEEEIDEEESDDEDEEEEESESDDESDDDDDEEDDDESDDEETVHQRHLPAGRGRENPEQHLRYRRAYY